MDSRCSFKAFGVTLLHFKVDKINWGGGHFRKKKQTIFFLKWGTPTLENPRNRWKTRISGYSRKILIPDHHHFIYTHITYSPFCLQPFYLFTILPTPILLIHHVAYIQSAYTNFAYYPFHLSPISPDRENFHTQ
jgi:hypothetical protein